MKISMTFRFAGVVLGFFLLVGCAANQNLQQKKTNQGEELTNIILVTIDTLRADHLGCYQHERIRTPHIDSLAQEGARFEHAYTSTPITLPAHASIMTGLYPQVHGVHNNATYYLGSQSVTLAEILNQAGYRTAAFIGSYVLHSRYGLNQGFEHYNDQLPEKDQGIESLYNLYEERDAAETTALALEWFAQNKDTPCFLWVHYFEPHAPYLPPKKFAREYIDQPYDGEIAYVDQCLGQLITSIKQMNVYSSTAIIVTSDHGEGLGEHKEMTHGVFIYDTTLHIPLIMRFPGIASVTIPELCRNIDIFPTILDYCDVSYPGNIQGESLIPLLLGTKKNLGLELVMESMYASENFGWANLAGIRNLEWKYIDAPSSELYDLINDPKEATNLWEDRHDEGKGMQQQWQRLCSQMEKQKQSDTQLTTLTPKVREQMKSLGYVWFPSTGSGKIDPKEMASVLDKLDRGVIYYTMGKYEQAIAELKELIQLNPENSMAHFHLGCAYSLKGDLLLAKDHFLMVTELDNRQVDAFNYLGYIYVELNNYKHAEEAFQKALELNPQYADVLYNLAIVYYQQGKFERSIEEFRQAALLNPNHIECLYNLGSLYLEMDRFDESKMSLQKALTINPDHPETRNSLGKLYSKQQDYEKAEIEFLAAIQVNSSYKESFNNLASVYIRQKRYSEAIVNLEKALVIDQNFGESYYNLGVVYRALGDFLRAIEYLKTAKDKGFSGYELCYATGDSLIRLGKYSQAKKWLHEAIALRPDSWKAHFDLGVVLSSETDQVDDAIKEYERAIALGPSMAAPYINLGIIYFQNSELSKAVQIWQQALEVEPDNVEAQINMGVAYIQLGSYELAIDKLKQSLILQPDNLNIHYNLAIVYIHQQRNKEAILRLRQALKIDPEFEAGKRLLEMAENQWNKN